MGSKGWVLGVVLMLCGVASAHAQGTQRVPVLVELFTSEGCNSCPPADALLRELLDEQSIPGVIVVALSEHVTYWDQQGWKDPFSATQFTTRQQQYGLRFNLDSIYTPQVVINGTREFVGSDRRSIERALSDAAKATKADMKLAVTASNGTWNISVSGEALAMESNAELLIAIVEDHLTIDVKRGENANRQLTHSAVVRVLRSAGDAKKAGALSIPIDPGWKRANLHVIAFVQSRSDRRVIGIAKQ